ncbi:MAG: hypothetical protein R2867_11940 [Caldilineaceae bacterium]
MPWRAGDLCLPRVVAATQIMHGMLRNLLRRPDWHWPPWGSHPVNVLLVVESHALQRIGSTYCATPARALFERCRLATVVCDGSNDCFQDNRTGVMGNASQGLAAITQMILPVMACRRV